MEKLFFVTIYTYLVFLCNRRKQHEMVLPEMGENVENFTFAPKSYAKAHTKRSHMFTRGQQPRPNVTKGVTIQVLTHLFRDTIPKLCIFL